MANEFIARNGLIAQNNSTVTGSVLITGNVGIGTTNPTSKLYVVTNVSGPVTPETRSAVVAINTSTDLVYPNSIGLYATVDSLQGFAVYGNNTSGFGYGGYFVGDGYFSNNVGIGKEASSVKLDVNGNATVTGSLRVTQGITGSLSGTATTASYVSGSIFTSANPALSASYALTASYVIGGGGGGGATPIKLISQTILSSSWVATGSYYTSSFTNSNITTTCDISITPQPSSYQTAYNAQVLPYIEVATGTGSLYSNFPPEANMIVDVVITQTT